MGYLPFKRQRIFPGINPDDVEQFRKLLDAGLTTNGASQWMGKPFDWGKEVRQKYGLREKTGPADCNVDDLSELCRLYVYND